MVYYCFFASDSWGQAMALLSSPSVAIQAGKQYMRLADVVWRYVGDDSLSLDWCARASTWWTGCVVDQSV